MRQKFIVGIGIAFICVIIALISQQGHAPLEQVNDEITKQFKRRMELSPTPISPPRIPPKKIINNDYHIFQTYNNCGPAALSMGLSYFDINVSQQALGDDLRPYKPIPGDNDDKSVTLEELGEKANEYGLQYYHRPNGSTEMLEKMIAADIPVITRTWLHPDEDIGHYRVVKGYDRAQQRIIQDDSYKGPNLSYDYAVFNDMWEKFNYEYLVLFSPEQESVVKEIIGENIDETQAWQNARENAEEMVKNNPNDIYARFNQAIALYHLGLYEESIAEYEQIEDRLPFRTLWYQIEPIDAYFQVGNYERVFEITQNLFENGNRAYAEAYVIRGKSYEAMGEIENAHEEYSSAHLYNPAKFN